MESERDTLFVVYNADGSVLGKLRYGYRKITSASCSEPTCAACDITHGGLSLTETPSWIKVKDAIQSEFTWQVVQLHRDELSQQLREYIQTNSISLPVAILQRIGAGYEVMLDRAELAGCSGSADKFVEELRAKQNQQRANL